MNILITNMAIYEGTGTELYVKDVCLKLKSLGIGVEIYCLLMGVMAEDLKSKGINVVTDLSQLKNTPDIIHGHHHILSDALAYFKNTPAIHFCHDRVADHDIPILHPNIKKYVAVDHLVAERFFENPGIDPGDISIIPNWVSKRFIQKKVIRQAPQTAVLFSNYASAQNYYPLIADACEKSGLQLTVAGKSMGAFCDHPEQMLGQYDIAFCKAKAAMEAMACGCAVILCDYAGMGEMVTTENFEYARRYNFGLKNLCRPHNTQLISAEIKKYHAGQAKAVSDLVRQKNDFDTLFEDLLQLYTSLT